MNQHPPAFPSLPKKSGLAVTSLILGILSLTCLWFISGIPAVICGHIAYSKVRKSGGLMSGEGLALAGLIMGYLSIALSLFVIPMMLAIAVPNFVKARDVAMKNACINNLRVIEGAKQQWALETEQKDTTVEPQESDLEEYLLNGLPVCPKGGTYSINDLESLPECSIPGHELPASELQSH